MQQIQHKYSHKQSMQYIILIMIYIKKTQM